NIISGLLLVVLVLFLFMGIRNSIFVAAALKEITACGAYIGHELHHIRLNKEEHGPPTGPPVNIEISGDDFTTLGELARQVEQKIQQVRGLVNIESDYDQGRPELTVIIDRGQAGLAGLTTSDIAFQIRTAIHGTEASKYRIGEDEYDITVRLAPESRGRLEDLDKLYIFKDGTQIPLVTVARLENTGGLTAIRRTDLKRVVTISAEVAERLPSDARKEAEELLAESIELPPGYRITFTGENEMEEEASGFLFEAFFIAVFLMAIVLVTQFNSVGKPLIIIFSVLLSFIGVLWGLMLLYKPFGIIMTGIGIISLAGVVVNNSIVLIDYISKLRDKGFSRTEAALQGGVVRFRPVMFTAITTILGLIPLTFGINVDFRALFAFEFGKVWEFGGESSQWWGPMGAAVIFGLAVATILTLIIVPVMYSLVDSIETWLKKMWHELFDQLPEEEGRSN
ncbi:efflux RND transporter permease subunit, partial [Acidobacteriota bacterium]